MAYVIPLKWDGERRQVLIIVLTPENLARMKGADPFDLKTHAYGKRLNLDGRIGDLDIVIAYEEDETRIREFAGSRDIGGLIEHLQRGWAHQPGDGTDPVSITGQTH